MYHSFRPGKLWLDDSGKRIQAHGSSILYRDGIFYWYGENKEGITGRATGEKCPYWHHGVKLYSSKDLYNWKDEGFAVKESDDPNNPFYPTNIMDRPHILYNEKTKKYVLWAKTSFGGFDTCTFSVCVGDDIHDMTFSHEVDLGPYHAGDFDLFQKEGRTYIVFENPHTCMVLAELSEDYLHIKGPYTEHLHEPYPPFVREAPAYFSYQGHSYLLTSGTTGYFPNSTKGHGLDDLEGTWVDFGETCIGDKNRNSFHSQFSSVFAHPHVPGLYIALGDRWLTDLPEDLPDMDKAFIQMFGPKADEAPLYSENLTDDNTSVADYVWLPVQIDENGKPFIVYRREWTIEEFLR